LYNPKQTIHEDFGTWRTDYNLRDRDRLLGAYTIDNGNSVIPLADPLFASALQLGAQVVTSSRRESFIRSAQGISELRSITTRPRLPSGRNRDRGGAMATAIASAGRNVNGGVCNRRNLFTYTDGVQIAKGIHQVGAGVWFQRVQDNQDTASQRLGVATFATLTAFLQGTLTKFSGRCLTTITWVGGVCLAHGCLQDSVKLRHLLTFQDCGSNLPRAGMSDRKGRQLRHGRFGCAAYGPACRRPGVHLEERDPAIRPQG
jgi:hypothetical protein